MINRRIGIVEILAGAGLILTLSVVVASAMSRSDARHLLNRTGFGATPAAIDSLSKLSWKEAVDQIVDGARTEPFTDLPYWADEPVGGLFTLRLLALQRMRGEDVRLERASIRRRQEAQTRGRAQEIRSWWWNEMIRTDSPLTERMVLFWHNHFTSEIGVVRSPELMLQQNRLFRKHALGNFADLVMAATKDAAMIIYLDNNSNVKGNPNENFARELMELFTLGEGHVYSEPDIREASRAFTGWRVDMVSKRFLFEEKLHDFDSKEFLGQKGDFNGDDIVRIILEHPRAAVFIAEKMWKTFISGDPDNAEVEKLATILRDSKYELKPLVRAFLMSDHFRAAKNRGNLIKSPVDLVVGSARMFGVHPAQASQISNYGARLGQDLFQPPDVAGWKGGPYWIDANTLITRHDLSRFVLAEPDESFIRRYEQGLRRKRAARLRADRERREIERLMKSQKSMLESMMETDGPIVADADPMEAMTGGATLDKLESEIEAALNKEMDPDDQAAMEIGSMKAMDIQQWIQQHGMGGRNSEKLARVLLPINPVHGDVSAMSAEEMVHSLLLDPAFQLK